MRPEVLKLYLMFLAPACALVPVLVAGDPVRDVGDSLPVTLFVPEATG